MPRQPSVAAPVFIAPAPLEQMTLRLRVITPFFGGGYTTREIDADNPIRSAAIRGSLRSWWRATAGAQFASAEALFEREAIVWGSDQRHGQVAIRVRHIKSGISKPSHSWRDAPNDPLRNFAKPLNNWPGYAMQPFQGQKVGGRLDPEPADGRVGDQFELTLTFPDSRRAEVEATVSAWVFYGGIGARTRRGCGSIAGEILLADGSTQPLSSPTIVAAPNAADDLTILIDV